MEWALGLLLGLGAVSVEQRDLKKGSSCAVNCAFGIHADAAALLAFSAQLASVVILIKKELGIMARGFGG